MNKNLSFFEKIFAAKLSRRQFAAWLAGGSIASLAGFEQTALGALLKAPKPALDGRISHRLKLLNGLKGEVLIAWGEPLSEGNFNPSSLNHYHYQEQLKSFGTHNDFTCYIPLNQSSSHGILGVNHEYVTQAIMFDQKRLKNPKLADKKLI